MEIYSFIRADRYPPLNSGPTVILLLTGESNLEFVVDIKGRFEVERIECYLVMDHALNSDVLSSLYKTAKEWTVSWIFKDQIVYTVLRHSIPKKIFDRCISSGDRSK